MIRGHGEINQFLSLFIGILGLILIGFFAYNLYNAFVSGDSKNANDFLNGLTAKIDNLKDGEHNTFLLKGIVGWYLLGWNKDDSISTGKPEKCFGSSCVCVCKNPNSCQEGGYCRRINDKSLIQFSTSEGVTASGPISDILFFDKRLEAAENLGFFQDKPYLFGNGYFKEGNKDSVMLNSKFTDIEDVDAAVFWESEKRLYLFYGSNYYRYDFVKKTTVGGNDVEEYIYDVDKKISGGSGLISSGWSGVPDNIDAAFYSPDTNPFDDLDDSSTYFFKDDLYWKFSNRENSVLPDYPRQISSFWKGISGPIDAAYRDGQDVYFIKGDQYYVYHYLTITSTSEYIGDSDFPVSVSGYGSLGSLNVYSMPGNLFEIYISKETDRISFAFGRDIPRPN